MSQHARSVIAAIMGFVEPGKVQDPDPPRT
jgi:hypothetical protein